MNNILSQAKTPDGTITEWANTPLGFSKNLIHSKGSAVVLLAEIMDLTPIEVNDKLKEVQGFNEDQTIWEKVMVAFPGWAAQFIEPYNNNTVLDALSNGRFVIVLTDTGHAVRYMGGGLCHDPKTGTEVPTLTYPNVKACVVVTHIEEVEKTATQIGIEKEIEHGLHPQEDTPTPVEPQKDLSLTGANKTLLKHIKSAKRAIREIEKILR